MSIFGTLLGLLGSGTAYGVANAKSKRKIRQMQDNYNRQFAKGCDPETEYIIACDTYKKVLNLEIGIEIELDQDIKKLHWQDLFKKYPEAVDRENNLRRYLNEPLVNGSEEDAKSFINFNFKHNAMQEKIKKEFLTDNERKNFSDDLQTYTFSDPHTFEKSVACVVAGREMCERGFTPIGSAGSIIKGGYYGYNSTKHPPAQFMMEITCNPNKQDKCRAMSAAGYIACERRNGAATSHNGVTQEDRNNKISKKSIIEFIIIVIVDILAIILLAILYGGK